VRIVDALGPLRRRCAAACRIGLLAALALAGGNDEASAAADTADLERAVRVSQAAIGRQVGHWPLTDHRGRSLRLGDLQGKPLVVNFIYTGCFQVCPATTQFLRSAVKSASDALGPGRFRVLSIGFNQPFDTPEALAAFARRQGIQADDWLFVAPRPADVEAILAEFGLTVQATAAGFDHLIQATIVDGQGRIYRQVYGDAFELPMFIGPLKELLSGQAAQQMSLENIWLKVKLYCTVYDPTSGRYKFNYSLFVELFAGITFLGALIVFVLRELRRSRRRNAVGRS
jgi:protein SCO1/2